MSYRSIVTPPNTKVRFLSDYAPRQHSTRGKPVNGRWHSQATPVRKRNVTPTKQPLTPEQVRANTLRNDGLRAHSDTRARLYT